MSQARAVADHSFRNDILQALKSPPASMPEEQEMTTAVRGMASYFMSTKSWAEKDWKLELLKK